MYGEWLYFYVVHLPSPPTFRFSGLTAEHFIGVEMTLEDVQQQLLQMFYNDTILLGHSLESDMRALKVHIQHFWVTHLTIEVFGIQTILALKCSPIV